MFHLELRLLGTQLLELRLGRGRQDDERTDEWWRGSLDDEADDSEESEPHEWIGCQFPFFPVTEEDDEQQEDDIDEEWATFDRDENSEDA
jgi:hypothetical protein